MPVSLPAAPRLFACMAAISLGLPTSAWAQDGWQCDAGICVEAEAQLSRALQGSFTGGTSIDPESQIDRFAALEQQRWLELRFEALAPTLVSPTFTLTTPDTLPDGWPADLAAPQPSLSILVSEDAETYTRLDADGVVQAGSYVSVLIGQGTVVDPDGLVHFAPSEWTLTVSSQRVLPESEIARAVPGIPALLPSNEGIALGCDTFGCGFDESDLSNALDVAGEPDPDPKPAPAAPTQTAAADDLARELQTELARVGCYTGAIDGLWGPNSRRAVTAFNNGTAKALTADTATAGALVAVAREDSVVCTGD